MADPDFDLTGRLNPVELTGSGKPFERTLNSAERSRRLADDPEFRRTSGLAMETVLAHLGQKADTVALIAMGLLEAERLFVPVSKRDPKKRPPPPEKAETPFIKAVLDIVHPVYDKTKEASPEDKKKMGGLILLALWHVEKRFPSTGLLLAPQYINLLKEQGFEMGDNIPPTLREGAVPQSTATKGPSTFTAALQEATLAIGELGAARQAGAVFRRDLLAQLQKRSGPKGEAAPA